MKHLRCLLSLFAALSLMIVSQSDAADAGSPAKAKTKIFCVGDSITFGAGTSNPATKSYPAQLGVLLGPDYEVTNLGNSGSTMLDEGDKPYKKQPEYIYAQDKQADVYIILLGANDSKPHNWAKKAGFVDSAKSLIATYQKISPQAKVYLAVPIIVTEAGNFGITNEVVHGEIAPLIKQLAAELKLDVIDLYPVLEKNPETLPDRVHPNDAGAALMAKAVYDVLVKE